MHWTHNQSQSPRSNRHGGYIVCALGSYETRTQKLLVSDLHQGKLLGIEDAILYVLADRVREALAGSPSAESLAGFLHALRVREFGVVGFPRIRERRAARKLLEIDVGRYESESD